MQLTWNKLREEPIANGAFRKLLRRTFRLPDGRTEHYDVKHEGRTVCVLALTKNRQVILATQYRPGPETVLHELPGGGIEDGEHPDDAAARELLEETGYAGRVQHVTQCLDCGYSTGLREVFVIEDCERIADPSPDTNEFIEVTLMPLDAFRALLRSGQCTDVEVGYLALDHLGLL
ncbi:MAG: NUDIX hydrolase [bacterium]|nr:NUDIX hydrolase [bacterium]